MLLEKLKNSHHASTKKRKKRDHGEKNWHSPKKTKGQGKQHSKKGKLRDNRSLNPKKQRDPTSGRGENSPTKEGGENHRYPLKRPT